MHMCQAKILVIKERQRVKSSFLTVYLLCPPPENDLDLYSSKGIICHE